MSNTVEINYEYYCPICKERVYPKNKSLAEDFGYLTSDTPELECSKHGKLTEYLVIIKEKKE